MSTPIAEAVLIGITTIGLNVGDKVIVNASIYQLNSTVTTSRVFTAPAGNTNPTNLLMNVAGDPSGTSDVRMQRQIISAEGPANFQDVRNRYAGVNINTSAGVTNHAYTDHSYITVTNGGKLGTGRTHFGHFGVSADGEIGEARVYEAGDLSVRDNGRVGISAGLRVANIGHPTAVRVAYGVEVSNFAAAALAVGVEVRTLAGPGKWAYRSIGDANSAFAGKTRIGSLHQPQYALDVTGDAQVTGAYRFANGVIFASGPGMPGYPAPRGSVYLSTDFGMVENLDGGMGWARVRK